MRDKPRYLVFTDLDGTLLDHDTYSWKPAAEALRRLMAEGIPWIFATSKTRAETEVWRQKTGNAHPFIVENGGAAFIPEHYFAGSVPGTVRRDNFEVLEWGTPYLELVDALKQAAFLSQCQVRGFHEMSVQEVATSCAMTPELAELAKRREYDEPFVVIGSERATRLVEAIEAAGLRCTRGGRFWHITGPNDKGAALRALRGLFEQAGGPVTTISLGDGLNDAPLLKEATLPVVIRSPQAGRLQELLPNAAVTRSPGPAGWAEAVLAILNGDP